MAHRRGNKEPQTPWCRNAGTQERRKEAVAVPGNAGTQAVMSNEDKPGGSLVWNWPHRESGNRERGGRGSVAGGAGGGGARGDNRGGAIMQAEAFLLSCGLPDGSSKTRYVAKECRLARKRTANRAQKILIRSSETVLGQRGQSSPRGFWIASCASWRRLRRRTRTRGPR